MTDNENKLFAALMVLLHSKPILDHLKTNDPMALKQALDAIDQATQEKAND